MWLFAIHISLVNVQISCPFLLGCFFSDRAFKSSLYILTGSSLSDICFADIFSKPMVCPFILLTVSSQQEKFSF